MYPEVYPSVTPMRRRAEALSPSPLALFLSVFGYRSPLERVVHRLGARRVPQPGRRDAVRERRLRRLRRSSRFHDGDDGAGVVHDDGDGRLHQRRLLRGRVDDALPFVQSHGERDGNARDRHLALFVFVGVRVVRSVSVVSFSFPLAARVNLPAVVHGREGHDAVSECGDGGEESDVDDAAVVIEAVHVEGNLPRPEALLDAQLGEVHDPRVREGVGDATGGVRRLLGRSSRSGGRGTHRGKLDGDLEDAEVGGVQSGRHGLELDRGDGGGASNLGERGALGGGHDAARQAHGPRATERSPVRSRALGDELIIVLFGVQSLVRRRLHRPRAAQRRVARGGGERSGGRRGI